MTTLTETPQYRIRGVDLYGFENMPSAVNFLMPPQRVRSGILVAINAEKILTAERDEVLLGDANDMDDDSGDAEGEEMLS